MSDQIVSTVSTGRSADAASPAHAQARADLTTAHRVADRFGMTDLTNTHFSVRDPDSSDSFLVTPYGALFHEVAADRLSHVRMTADGPVARDELNPAGAVIHEAIYAARPDVEAICHTHTTAGLAVSCCEDGLLPISQFALHFYGHVGYHDYEGATLVPDERRRLQESLGDHEVLFLRNHGLLTVGASAAEAFLRMYYLDRACQAQVATLSQGLPLVRLAPEICQTTRDQYAGLGDEDIEAKQALEWAALERLAALPTGGSHA